MYVDRSWAQLMELKKKGKRPSTKINIFERNGSFSGMATSNQRTSNNVPMAAAV